MDYNKPEKIIVVSTTKFSGGTRKISKDDVVSRITINNSPVVMIVNGNSINAHYKVNDVLIEINAAGITIDEIEAFIASSIN